MLYETFSVVDTSPATAKGVHGSNHMRILAGRKLPTILDATISPW